MSEHWRVRAREVARVHGLDPDVFERLIRQESGFDPTAVSRAGAIGLTQLMPATAQDLGVDPRDPEQNLRGGARFLRQMLDRYGGDYRIALAAYNAGPGNVDRYGGVPPFEETQLYLERVLPRGTTKTLARVVAQEGTEMESDTTAARPLRRNDAAVAELRTEMQRIRGDMRKAEQRVESLTAQADETEDMEVRGEIVTTPTERARSAQKQLVGAQSALTSLNQRHQSVVSQIAQLSRDTATATTREPSKEDIEARRLAIEKARFDLERAKRADAEATSPEARRLAQLGVEKAELEVSRARAQLDLTLNPRAPQRAPVDPQDAELKRLQIAKAQRDLAPMPQQLLSDAWNTVGEIERMLKAGQFGDASSPDVLRRADAYRDATMRNLDAQLKGTTVAAEDAARRAEERARQAAGEAILSRRMQTGTSMAQALLGAAMGVRMPKGQSSLGFDPAAAAWLLTEQMGGGPEVSALGREMLLGARGGPPQETLELPPLPPIGSGAPVGGAPLWPGVPAPASPAAEAPPPPPAPPPPTPEAVLPYRAPFWQTRARPDIYPV